MEIQQVCYRQAWGEYGISTQGGMTEAKRGRYKDLSKLQELKGQRQELGRRRPDLSSSFFTLVLSPGYPQHLTSSNIMDPSKDLLIGVPWGVLPEAQIP